MKETVYLEGNDHIIEGIKELPILKEFKIADLKKLLRLSKVRSYDPNEFIIEEGASEHWMYFLISGAVKIEKQGKRLGRIGTPGEIFGEMGFLDGKPRSASIKAEAATTCFAIDASHLDVIKKETKSDAFCAEMYKMFGKMLAHRLRTTTINYLEAKKEIDRLKKF